MAELRARQRILTSSRSCDARLAEPHSGEDRSQWRQAAHADSALAPLVQTSPSLRNPRPASLSMESAVLLRVPAALAEQLHKQLAGNSSKDKDKERGGAGGDEKDGSTAAAASSSSSGPSLKLSFLGPDGGVMLQQSHSPALSGQLVNLPTIVEVHKTFDNIHYYKCADVSQMIVVQATTGGAATAAAAHAPSSLNANPPRPKNANDPAAGAAAAAPIPVDYPHGLTPPTRDIRPKRYERDTKVPPRIVTEVDSLMANIKDNKAVNYFELVEDEEEIGEEEESEEEMADEAAEEEEERRQQQLQQQEDDERRRQRTDEPARSAQQTSFQQAQKLLSTPAVHRGATPDVRAVAGTPFLAVSASPLRSSPLNTSVFGASPAVHVDTADMTDVSLDLFSQNAGSAAAAGSSSAAAAASSAASLQPVSSPSNLLSINVSGVEGMFGSSPQQAQQAGATQPMDLASFLPETPHTPVQAAAAAGFPAAAASAAAAAPPSAADLVRAELSAVQSRISVAEKEIAESKNMLLKRKAEQRLQALQEEKRAIEAKL